MPKFRITADDGRTLVISGDTPPTEQETQQLFASVAPKTEATQQPQQAEGFDIKNLGLIGDIISSLVDPFVTTGKVVGAAAVEPLRLARTLKGKDPFFDDQGQPIHNPFLTEAEETEVGINPLGFLGGQVARSANIASFGIGAGAGAAKTAATRVLHAANQGAKIGGIRGLTAGSERIVPEERLSPEDKLAQTLQNTLVGVSLGGVTGGAMQGAGEVFNWIGSRAAPLKEKLANQILGQTRTQVRLDPEGHNQLSMKLIDKLDDGSIKPGDYQSLRTQADQLVKRGEDKIREEFARKGSEAAAKTADLSSLTTSVEKAISAARSAGNLAKANALDNFKKTIEVTWGKTLNASQVLQLKRVLEDQLNETVFKQGALQAVGTKASARVAGQRLVSASARDWIRRNVPNVSSALDDESVGIALRKTMEAQLQRMGQAPIGRFGAQGLSLTNLPFKAASRFVSDPLNASRMINTGGVSLPPVLQQFLGRSALTGAIETGVQGGN